MNILHFYHSEVKLKMFHQIDNFVTLIVGHHKVCSTIRQYTENALMIYFIMGIQTGSSALSSGSCVWRVDEKSRIPTMLGELFQFVNAITFVERESARVFSDRTKAVY